jgi:arsenite methyltransferase
MSTTLSFDADLASRVETVYATPDVAATRIVVFRAGAPHSGEKVLDIGCGPGYLTRELALAVGPRGQAIGVDISEPMLGLARHRCADLSQVRLESGDATKLPLDNASIDLACGLQVFCYIKELDAALAELRRVLKPGGRAVILDTDASGFIWESRDPARMRKMLAAFEAHAAWPDLPRILPRRLQAAGFEVARCDAVPMVTLRYHPNTYVHGLARFIHGFVSKNPGITKEEADAWLAEFDSLEQQSEFFFAVNRFVFTAIPSRSKPA